MKKIILILLTFTLCYIAEAQNTFTNGTGNGYWNDNGNWSLGRTPNSFDIAVIPNGFSCTLRDGQAAVAYDINVADGGALLVNGTLTLEESGTVVSDVTNPVTGKTWMDRNLGASQVATSYDDELAYGDLYQWGRLTDGHEIRTSSQTDVRSAEDIPGYSEFIVTTASPFDWRDPRNDNLWVGVDGLNNPCPEGYRLPTAQEWNDEIATWTDVGDYRLSAFNSVLKLTSAGFRFWDGTLQQNISTGDYWSGEADPNPAERVAFRLTFTSTVLEVNSFGRSYGRSVRCIKD